ncbi:MAG TPA: hypothetical protein HA256_07490 [Methanoregulaceae archaeon]|jgi:hypothetical protein|nr:hypothetical protein [Methanoregulaceae archaeon]
MVSDSYSRRVLKLLHVFTRVNNENLVEFLALVILGVLLILDVLTTSLVLSVGGYETNVLMEGIVTIPVVHLFLKWLFLVFVVIAARFCDWMVQGTGLYIMCVIIGWYSLVIANNTLIFLRLLA